jgi:hypothetical protein
MFKILWAMMNGKKFNTGTIVMLAVFALKYFGMDGDQATQICTSIMLGVGAVITLVGFVHRMIKAEGKKE